MITHRYDLDSGAALEFEELDWTLTGRLYCLVNALAPDGSVLGSTKLELSNSTARYQASKEFAARNGRNPGQWADALLKVWLTLDEERRISRERFAPVELSQAPEPGPQRFLWGTHLPFGFENNLYGSSDSNKTTLAIWLAVSIALGIPFLGLSTVRGPVLFLDYELDREPFLRRLYQICRGMGLEAPPVQLFYQSLRSPLVEHLEAIQTFCSQEQTALIIVDSLGLAASADPNDAKAFIEFTQALRRLEGQTWLLVDHQSKTSAQAYNTKTAIGSVYKQNLVRDGLQLESVSSVKGKASIVLRHSKHNFSYEAEPLACHVLFEPEQISFEVADPTSPEFSEASALPLPLRVLKILQETAQPISDQDLVEAAGTTKASLKNTLTKLRRNGNKIKTLTEGKKTSYQLETAQPKALPVTDQ